MSTTTIELSHIFGSSYFGSGGGYGRVYCSGNCRTVGSQDNGFMSGPAGVEVIDPDRPARFYARGGDEINEGRVWMQAGHYTPGHGWSPAYAGDSKEERQAWLRSPVALGEPSYQPTSGD